jgi:hypothetical protein
MRGRISALGIAGICVTGLALGGPAAFAADRCVGKGTGCYSTIQAAVDASRDGDSISIRPGSYAGGISIAKSIRLTGAGADATVIRGGGPVVTIGTPFAASEPTVSISGVTITGGRTNSSPASDMWAGGPVVARGGGVFVPPAAGLEPGATVSIRNSVVSGNRVAPTATIGPNADQLPFWPKCPGGPCPYAGAEGGGINTWGALKLADTLVAENVAAGPITSDAVGAGVWSGLGDLVIVRSAVLRNRAVAVAPNGRNAEGGGIFADGGTVTIRDSSVAENLVSLSSTWPVFADDELIEQQAHSGGIHIGDGVPTVVDGVRITGNTASASDPQGEPLAFDSAMLVNDSPLTMRDTVIAGNRTVDIGATTADVGPAGSALEVDGGGTIENTSIINNTFLDVADDNAGVTGAVAVYNFSDHEPELLRVRRSVIAGNRSRASSASGTATAQGGGIVNNSLLALHHTVVSANTLAAAGPAGATEEGGGIWNGVLLSGPPVELRLEDSAVTGNVLRSGAGVSAQGGGVFTTLQIALLRTVVAGNRPDQCFGCGTATPARVPQAADASHQANAAAPGDCAEGAATVEWHGIEPWADLLRRRGIRRRLGASS